MDAGVVLRGERDSVNRIDGERSRTGLMMKDILAIDDDPAVRAALGRVLESAGFRVRVMPDGKQGLATFARQKVDLLITDIFMPEQEGLAVIREVRGRAPCLPILAISGHAYCGRVDFLNMARHLGATGILAKPFEPATMIDCVRHLLGGSVQPWAPPPGLRHGLASASARPSRKLLWQ